MTTVRTPLIILVRSVTVDTTRWGSRPPPRSASPAKVNWMPGARGFHGLSILGGLGKLAGSNCAAVLHGGGLAHQPML